MSRRLARWAAPCALAAACLMLADGGAEAQTAPQFQPMQPSQPNSQQFRSETPPEPDAAAPEPGQTGSIGDGWATDVQQDRRQSEGQGSGTFELVQRINDYFNGIENLEGRFVQHDPNDKRTRGRFYVQRPGRLRFDYAPPSLMRIVADGSYLSIEDHDLNTIDKYPLDSTPFRMLLREDVDLLRDAHIVNVAERDDQAILTIEDKSGDAVGRLMLKFDIGRDEITMREWVITDPQGLDTRIQLADLVTGKKLDREFFTAATLGFPKTD